MPRRKKKPSEWTTFEAMKHLFPKKVRDKLHEVAHEKDDVDSDTASDSSSQEESSTKET